MFLLFQRCGILTVPDSVECSYCSYSVVFQLSPTMWNVITDPTVCIVNVPDEVECSYGSNSVVF